MEKINKISLPIMAVLFFLGTTTFLGFRSQNVTPNDFQSEGWKAPKSADNLKNPLFKDKGSVEKGEKLFVQDCVTCHGKSGLGDGIAGSALNPKPSNLTSSSVQKQSDGAIFWKISNGRNAMIPWKYSLSENQRWQLVNFIRTLAKKNVKK